jgi:hypothetical protein
MEREREEFNIRAPIELNSIDETVRTAVQFPQGVTIQGF